MRSFLSFLAAFWALERDVYTYGPKSVFPLSTSTAKSHLSSPSIHKSSHARSHKSTVSELDKREMIPTSLLLFSVFLFTHLTHAVHTVGPVSRRPIQAVCTLHPSCLILLLLCPSLHPFILSTSFVLLSLHPANILPAIRAALQLPRPPCPTPTLPPN